LLLSPVADLSGLVSPLQDAGMQVYNSFSGCRDHSALHGGWDTHSSALGLQTQQNYVICRKMDGTNGSVLSEISQTQKNKCPMFPLKWGK
jgi:hypothetical protein